MLPSCKATPQIEAVCERAVEKSVASSNIGPFTAQLYRYLTHLTIPKYARILYTCKIESRWDHSIFYVPWSIPSCHQNIEVEVTHLKAHLISRLPIIHLEKKIVVMVVFEYLNMVNGLCTAKVYSKIVNVVRSLKKKKLDCYVTHFVSSYSTFCLLILNRLKLRVWLSHKPVIQKRRNIPCHHLGKKCLVTNKGKCLLKGET